MTCTAEEPRIVYRGSTEFLDVEVTASVQLDDDTPVAFSFDNRVTWLEAAWEGSPATTRTASLLVDDELLGTKSTTVYVRITDNPEVPIVNAGTVSRA